MKTIELLKYSRKKIKGRRSELLIICLPPLFAEIFFLISEAGIYSILLYNGAFSPQELFTGGNDWQIIAAAALTLLRWVATAPLYCASAVRLLEFADENGKKTLFSEMLSRGRFLWRSISSFLLRKVISAVALVPSVVSGIYAVCMLSSGAGNRELFISSNLIVLCLVFFGAWVAVKISMMSVPFLLAQYPEKSGAGAVFMSFGFMRGRKKIIVGTLALFLLPSLTVVAVPFIIPDIVSAYISSVSIFFKEDDYKRSEKRTGAGRKFFTRKKRGRA